MKINITSVVAILALAGCAQQPSHTDWSAFRPQKPQSLSDCRMLQASMCAYEVKQSGSLASDFCAQAGGGDSIGLAGGPDFRDAVLIKHSGGDLIIAFRGTMPPGSTDEDTVVKDWKNDANTKLSSDNLHKGFKNALDNVWAPLLEALKHQQITGKIYVTGHSKGGAVAMIAALKLKQEGFPIAGVYTFAAARPGGSEFANQYHTENITTWRYENQGDVVPHLPPNSRELAAFGELREPPLNEFLAQGNYESVGNLRYVTDSSQLIELTQDNVPFEERRLEEFKKMVRWEVRHAHLVRTLVGNHSSEGRYLDAVCGVHQPAVAAVLKSSVEGE